MAMSDACPPPTDFDDYLAGSLNPDSAARFEQHCDGCEDCTGALQERMGDADLARALGTWEPGEVEVDGTSLATRLPGDLHERLTRRPENFTRYRVEHELGRGGMARVVRAVDEDLGRALAIKLLSSRAKDEEQYARHVDRFLEEAQVTSRLDHPGIVPVHELGLDPDGRLYFTMKLVRGRTLASILTLPADSSEAWSTSRTLRALLKVCEAMAYAHSKGVIHRDLKPDNVMVGRYGEVYVVDWGLARVQGHADTRDLRIAPTAPMTEELHSDRRERERESADGSPLFTLDGDVVGTPSFMSPEQAQGRLDEMGPHSDVYAVGAILYQLLSGAPPFQPRGSQLSSLAIWSLVQAGPPTALARCAPDASPELSAICERAMAREIDARYPSMEELASDLSAWMEGRVVAAYGGGAWATAKKWVVRNPALAGALMSVVLALVSSALGWSRHIRGTRDLARAAERTALLQHTLTIPAVEQMLEEADRLWPLRPDRDPDWAAWTERAEGLLAGGRERLGLDEIRRLLEQDPGGDGWVRTRLGELPRELLARIARSLEAFEAPRTGFLAGASSEHGWGVARRRDTVADLVEHSLTSTEARALWEEATAEIGDPRRSPAYDGLDLPPQFGLLPLGPDPRSGLWEFAHLPSGEPALRGADGELEFDDRSGLVFVLLPAGQFLMGAQREDSALDHHDHMASRLEGPPHMVSLDAFFLSKYELTMAQWTRLTGEPAVAEIQSAPLAPLSKISREPLLRNLERHDLSLPTEAQWEYGARGGTSSPWWPGWSAEAARSAAHFLPKDGVGDSAPIAVTSKRPNPYGLLLVHGNMAEWCLDVAAKYDGAHRAGDGLLVSPDADPDLGVTRGGAFTTKAIRGRSASREMLNVRVNGVGLGARPARPILPASASLPAPSSAQER